ncbi:unnamed protein product [Rhizophagus irregularis]|nr:unnamed protein product [Rhizophagus irregularis]
MLNILLEHPILKIKQIYEVRWLSWYEAIKNLCLSIEPLMDILLETITSTPNNSQRQNFISLYAEICDWKLLAFLHFLWDILELTLNKIQQQFLDYDDDGRLSLGEHLNKFLSHFSEEENNYTVVLEIQERFPDRPLLNSMKILDHANWPSNKEELTNYGEEELNMLSEFYKKEINNICGKWFGYKAIIHSNFRNIKIEKLLPRLFEFYYNTFPNIIKLLGIIYSIPFSSVDCERGFSKQNLIKTDLRNSLNNETLHYWMMVGLEETNLSEFDFTRALQIWNSACKRRI